MGNDEKKQIGQKYKDLPFDVELEGDNTNLIIHAEKMDNFKKIFGVETNGAIQNRLYQLSITAPKKIGGATDPEGLKKSTRELQELGPQDATESQIMAQMVSVNSAYFEVLGYFHNHKIDWKERKQCLDAASKLSKTYQSLVNTLRQWRTQGVQTVKHVHVGDGGQAAFIERYEQGGGQKYGKNE